ncbi:MAG: DinB family protein [Deinococcota bacterium]|jgi:hypothetical protein|nr:DinB family protein [Deinococcota bacterium]
MSPYLERILSYLGDQDPIGVLTATPGRLEHLFERAGPGDFARAYAPGKWTAREILAHLADVELAMGFRFRQAVSVPGHQVQPFDQDLWAARYARLEPSLALETFRALRAWNLALFASFSLQDWLVEAVHPERGVENVDVMVRFLAGHDLNHLSQLQATLEKSWR